jgi:hypothetical protein
MKCSYRLTREDSPLHRHFHEHTCNSKEVPELGRLFKKPSGIGSKAACCGKVYGAMCIYHIDRGHRLVPHVPYNMASHSLQKNCIVNQVSSPWVPFHEFCNLSFILAFPTKSPEGVTPALRSTPPKPRAGTK